MQDNNIKISRHLFVSCTQIMQSSYRMTDCQRYLDATPWVMLNGSITLTAWVSNADAAATKLHVNILIQACTDSTR